MRAHRIATLGGGHGHERGRAHGRGHGGRVTAAEAAAVTLPHAEARYSMSYRIGAGELAVLGERVRALAQRLCVR